MLEGNHKQKGSSQMGHPRMSRKQSEFPTDGRPGHSWRYRCPCDSFVLTQSKSVQYSTNHTVLNTDNPNPIRKAQKQIVPRNKMDNFRRCHYSICNNALCSPGCFNSLNWHQNDLWMESFLCFEGPSVRLCLFLLSVC